MRESYRDRLAGISIEHKPDYHVVLRLVGDTPVETLTLGSGAVPVRVVTGAGVSLSQLDQAISANLAAAQKLLPTMLGITRDERTGEIRIDVQATPMEAPAIQAQLPAVQQLLGQPVRIRTMNGEPTKHAVRAGSNLQMACTTGFVVQTGTSKGPLTAAHCPIPADYYDMYDGTAYDQLTGPSTAMRDDASHDVRWLNASAWAVPQFYADTSTPRTLTGRRTQTNTAVGSTVCHYGAATGYSCGSVESTAYTPTKPVTTTNPDPYYCGPLNNITCSNTWVQVGGSSIKCNDGDSGGPWFSSTIAFGVHAGGVRDRTYNYCISAWYMSTDRISTGLGSGYSLVYGP